MVMTGSQSHDARMLIPCAYELNAPPHRARRSAQVEAAASSAETPRAASPTTAHVVSAAPGPTTRWRKAAALLGDVALITGLIYGVAVVPALAVWGIGAATTVILNTFGRP
jgi:hypothetical protein